MRGKGGFDYLRFLVDMGEREVILPGRCGRSADGGTAGELLPKEKKTLSRKEKEEALAQLYQEALECKRCPLYATRTNLVFGCGPADAEVMFVGEAPGAEEDKRGIPFVGRAGKLLDTVLSAANLPRREVYIANVLKCRPPENRDPLPEEEHACLPFLRRQIEIIEPKVICCLGRIAARALLRTKEPMKNLRGIVHSFRGTPLVVTYHPAAILRNDKLRKPLWQDFQFLLEVLEKQRGR